MEKNRMLIESHKSGFGSQMSIFIKRFSLLAIALASLFSVAFAQNANIKSVELDQIRWKSESEVRSILGEPKSVHGPTGTHASYILWKYDELTVAFSNGRVFHMFDPDSLKKVVLDENR
jgi:hypothetical protein